MKLNIYKEDSRGTSDFNWLKSKFSFSFGNYWDEKRTGFGALRVLNDDWIAPGSGFPEHAHNDMEIFTIPLSGYLRHQDNTGKESIITKGDIQIMSTGTGVTHSEFNNSITEPVELLQIWITPNVKKLTPRHEDRFFPHNEEKNVLHTIITPDGKNDTLKIHQDAYVHLGKYEEGKEITYTLHKETHGLYIFVIEGMVTINSTILEKRDSAEITHTKEVSMTIHKDTFVLIIEVPLD